MFVFSQLFELRHAGLLSQVLHTFTNKPTHTNENSVFLNAQPSFPVPRVSLSRLSEALSLLIYHICKAHSKFHEVQEVYFHTFSSRLFFI